MRTRQNDFGGAGTWFLLILVVAGAWVGYNIGQLYFDRSSIESEVALMIDEELVAKRGGFREKVARVLDQHEAAYNPETILIDMNSTGSRMSIQAEYEKPANLLVTQIPMKFKLYVQREQAKVSGVVQGVQQSVEDSYNNSAQKYQKALQNAQPQAPAVDTNQ